MSALLKNDFTKKLNDISVPEHKLGVFECAVSDLNANVVWLTNDQAIDVISKKFLTLSIGAMRRLTIRNCLKSESNTVVKCKWNDLETQAKLVVTGNYILLFLN